MAEKPYLTIEDVARRFGVNPTTVYRLAQRGALPGFKIGNQWRFSGVRLDEWVATREQKGQERLPASREQRPTNGPRSLRP